MHRLAQWRGLFTRHSIGRQLIMGIALVHAVLMTIFVFDLVHRQRSFLHDQTIAQTESLANTVATNSVSWVLARDVVGLEEIMQSISGYPGMSYAMVLAPDGKVLAHTDKALVGRYISDPASRVLLASDKKQHRLETDLRLVDIAAPVLSNGRFIAWARVGVSGEKVSASLGAITRNGVGYTLAAILIGTVFAVMLARSITAGLQQLMVVTSGIREGQSEGRARVLRQDEIGELARDFNLTLDVLEAQRAAKFRAWQELERHRDHLEDLVRERTTELERARDEALAATQAKSEFLARMSHELRTPLNSIIGFTSIVKQGGAGTINEVQANQLGIVYSSARHLLSLINDVLDLSKVEARKVELNKTRFEINPLFQELAEVMQPQAGTKGLQLNVDSCSDPQYLYTDRGRLYQILLNLLGNAVKFTEQGSVGLTCKRNGEQVMISVSDTGIGIERHLQDHIFDPFTQADAGDNRDHEGTGLGLAIVRQFTELLGGHVELQSEPGQGSTFTIILPWRPEGMS